MADAKEKPAAKKAAKEPEPMLSLDCESGPRFILLSHVAALAESLSQDSQPKFCRCVIPETGEQVVVKEPLNAVARKCGNMLGNEVLRPEGPGILAQGTRTAAEQNAR